MHLAGRAVRPLLDSSLRWRRLASIKQQEPRDLRHAAALTLAWRLLISFASAKGPPNSTLILHRPALDSFGIFNYTHPT